MDNATRRFFADRRARVPLFIRAHFSLRGTLRLHRVALGWDIAKAPLNLSLAGSQIALQLASRVARKLRMPRTARVLDRSILWPTAVSREIEWLIHTELLQLPIRQPGRESRRDRLAEMILEEPAIRRALSETGPLADDPAFQRRLHEAIAEYRVSRTAAAEITTGLLSLGAGAIALNKLTPGAASLGPSIAAIMAQQAAVASFPLGGWLGGTWYGWFPAAPSAGLVLATTGCLMLGSATVAAFAGVVSDPIQRALGLHRARLLRMIGALEHQLRDPSAPAFAVHDHYVARLLDLFDIVGAALRIARG